jgi:hypothetical protein
VRLDVLSFLMLVSPTAQNGWRFGLPSETFVTDGRSSTAVASLRTSKS